jgi:hypothetical protein
MFILVDIEKCSGTFHLVQEVKALTEELASLQKKNSVLQSNFNKVSSNDVFFSFFSFQSLKLRYHFLAS